MSLFHVHYDRNWQLSGANMLYECRCGARRVRQAYTGVFFPLPRGWPDLVNRHGCPTTDTGWVKP